MPYRHEMPASTDRAAVFVSIFEDEPVGDLVANLKTDVHLLVADGTALPCTTTTLPTCYICSPSIAYVAYAREELRLLGLGLAIRGGAAPLLILGGWLVALAGLDRQIQINNWLLSTNPPPLLSATALARMRADLVAEHEDKVLYWRSLNECADDILLGRLKDAGWRLLPARMVYLFDARADPPRLHQNERRDRDLLFKSSYRIVAGRDFTPADFARAETLYAMLYIGKYTALNPRYTALFLARMVAADLFDLRGLRSPDGQLDGVIGFFDREAVMTAPVVGYDTALDPAIGLYRMLMAIGFERARQRSMLFNISAGAASFKRLRGASPALEYSAVYNRHLPWFRRAAAATLAGLLTRLAVPLLRKRGL